MHQRANAWEQPRAIVDTNSCTESDARRVYMNVAQEAVDDLNDLIESEMVTKMCLSGTSALQRVSAYQG